MARELEDARKQAVAAEAREQAAQASLERQAQQLAWDPAQASERD